MNSGKTHKYFTWAADHATVPEYHFLTPPSSQHSSADHPVYMGEKRPDYIFKADDDALIVLGEMERRVRVLPRKLTFFGCEYEPELTHLGEGR